MTCFRHPFLVRGTIYTRHGAFQIQRGVLDAPDAGLRGVQGNELAQPSRGGRRAGSRRGHPGVTHSAAPGTSDES